MVKQRAAWGCTLLPLVWCPSAPARYLRTVHPSRHTAYLLMGCAMLLLSACAQVKEPEGGPRDTRAPQLLRAQPPQGSTGFGGTRIVLQFDERVKVERVRERMLVSPPLDRQPTVRAGGDQVTIDLNAPLRPNTTYTFSIGEAVMDLTEGNRAVGLTYVVSTGSHVDSLSLHGRVLEAATGQPAKEALVLLHTVRDTGDVRTTRPAYFTRTTAEGFFTINNLPGEPMRLTALRDGNGNFRYDLPSEEVAFHEEPVIPGDTVPKLLLLFLPEPAKQLVVQAKVLEERGWQLVMAKRADSLSLRSVDRQADRLTWWPEWNEARDTVIFWPSDTTLLQGQRFLLLEGGHIQDTLTYQARKPMPFYLKVEGYSDALAGDRVLESSRPIALVDTSRARLLVDSMEVPWLPEPDTLNRRRLRMPVQATPESRVELVLYPKAIQAVAGGTNDTTRLSLGTPDPRSLGTLKVIVEVDSVVDLQPPLLLRLRPGQGQQVREQVLDSLPGQAHWTHLKPGNYRLELVEDRDGNGRWTTGSYVGQRQPERVFFYPEPVTLRAGWVLDRTWSLKKQR